MGSRFDALRERLEAAADPKRAIELSRFFKTGEGQYGEGDRFRGIGVPEIRAIVKTVPDAALEDALELLRSEWHEDRLAALMVLIRLFERGAAKTRAAIFKSYLKNVRRINNWDLVDLSAPQIVGGFLLDKPEKRGILHELVKSPLLWERRVAMVASLTFIRAKDFSDALRLAEALLGDGHDLMRKASGWMLREVGKRDVDALRGFLDRYSKVMPRTMLRYSIERLSEAERRKYMAK
jgi:3-methyladenine DNA glycosylase AlkD